MQAFADRFNEVFISFVGVTFDHICNGLEGEPRANSLSTVTAKQCEVMHLAC